MAISRAFLDPIPIRDHDSLAHDLAIWLSTPPRGSSVRGRLTWENIEFPDAERCRPDVYSIMATLTPKKWCPITFEVKANRADFMAEMRSSKWECYRPFSAYIFLACRENLVQPSEVPKEMGLIIKKGDGWTVIRRGQRNPNWCLSERQWMNLALKGRNPSPFEIFQNRGLGHRMTKASTTGFHAGVQ